jgi:uncharacterized membrane protein
MTPQILFAFLTALLMSIGQIFFKKASIFNLQHENINFIIRYLTNPWFITGLFIFGVSTITWVRALSGENLSKIYPLTSLAYILTMFFAYYIFNEKITPNIAFGTLLVFIGIIVINLGK